MTDEMERGKENRGNRSQDEGVEQRQEGFPENTDGSSMFYTVRGWEYYMGILTYFPGIFTDNPRSFSEMTSEGLPMSLHQEKK